ncbi:hypothetical protein [Acrocarpospora sp. B8E8]|uniref:hypothetical protein n=1 Tax=Acrocarpospora sp. B8E8 TaxID=3153572 RepID=UPI00325EEF36
MTNYRKIANEFAGPGHEGLVEAIAVYHHGYESMHMHQDIGKRVCSYCWLRAGRAVGVMVSRGALAVGVLAEVLAERARQDEKFGPQNWPDGTSDHSFHLVMADQAREACQQAAREGAVTWFHILREEFWEGMSEVDPARLRAELLQIAAVSVAWVEALDRRTAPDISGSPSDLDVPELLIDPDCRDGKCGSCVGGPCEHGCHQGGAVAEQRKQVRHGRS